MTDHTLRATVFIPTYNGEKYLGEIIDAVYAQSVEYEYELLIIDSGSTDGTLEIIHERQRNHPDLRLHEIPNTEFGHGKTRNLAAQLAKGEFIVYLSHDAIPANDTWLYEMLKPFELSERIVAVMGKQIPRTHCIPMLKYEINAVFQNFGPDFGTSIFYKDSFITNQGIYDAVRFYSDVNSATRTEFIKTKMPYRDVSYAEDQMFGEDIIEAGYMKAYAPRGLVVHSNDLTLGEYAKRMFDETYGLKKTGYAMAMPSLKSTIKTVLRGASKDTLRLLSDPDYTLKRRVYWLLLNPLFHVEKWRGVRHALNESTQGRTKVRSLEESRKKLT